MTRLGILLTWCSDNNIRIDPRIEVVDREDTGISVYSRDSYIDSLVTREFIAHSCSCSRVLSSEENPPHCETKSPPTLSFGISHTHLWPVVTIPKTAVLSVRSCTITEMIPHAPVGHGAHLALSLAVYSEM